MKQAALDAAMALNFDAFRESYDPNEMSSKFGGQRFGNMNSGGATPRASIRLSSQLLIQSAMFTGSKYEYEYERSTSNNSSVSPNQDQNRNSLRRADAWNDDVRGEVSALGRDALQAIHLSRSRYGPLPFSCRNTRKSKVAFVAGWVALETGPL